MNNRQIDAIGRMDAEARTAGLATYTECLAAMQAVRRCENTEGSQISESASEQIHAALKPLDTPHAHAA